MELTAEDLFLVIGCDGLWDVIDHDLATRIVCGISSSFSSFSSLLFFTLILFVYVLTSVENTINIVTLFFFFFSGTSTN